MMMTHPYVDQVRVRRDGCSLHSGQGRRQFPEQRFDVVTPLGASFNEHHALRGRPVLPLFYRHLLKYGGSW